jgi:hypothetical protein
MKKEDDDGLIYVYRVRVRDLTTGRYELKSDAVKRALSGQRVWPNEPWEVERVVKGRFLWEQVRDWT